ncbi:Pr6Pr family membrane protein [Flavobacterium sp. FlaQc-57]|uniref:Pr6Pr family membrane protein n=1 Tax=Flavobacterium sp. FlaQc-57 TaxID=3374186 RepID=UPI003756EBE1
MSSLNVELKAKVFSASIVLFFAWVAIVFQLYLTEGSVLNFFSYFTVLSNLLIALCLTFSTFMSKTRIGLFFLSNSVQTAIALYILIVGVVYNIVLRGLWVVTGWQFVVDNMLHVLNPILYILYWLIFSPKEKLNWKNGIYWTFFPICYLIYSLIRGAIVNWYPYPFLNAMNIGYEKVFINVVAMIFLFFVAGLSLISLNNRAKK